MSAGNMPNMNMPNFTVPGQYPAYIQPQPQWAPQPTAVPMLPPPPPPPMDLSALMGQPAGGPLPGMPLPMPAPMSAPPQDLFNMSPQQPSQTMPPSGSPGEAGGMTDADMQALMALLGGMGAPGGAPAAGPTGSTGSGKSGSMVQQGTMVLEMGPGGAGGGSKGLLGTLMNPKILAPLAIVVGGLIAAKQLFFNKNEASGTANGPSFEAYQGDFNTRLEELKTLIKAKDAAAIDQLQEETNTTLGLFAFQYADAIGSFEDRINILDDMTLAHNTMFEAARQIIADAGEGEVTDAALKPLAAKAKEVETSLKVFSDNIVTEGAIPGESAEAPDSK